VLNCAYKALPKSSRMAAGTFDVQCLKRNDLSAAARQNMEFYYD